MTKEVHYKILLVDDDTFISDMYALKFSNAGHELDVANSVDDALKKLQAGNEYDAVATDLIMPEKDGFDFLKEGRDKELFGDAVLIVLSNQDDHEVKEKFKTLGALEHIVKAHALPNEVVARVVCAIDAHKYDGKDGKCPVVGKA
jgi:DNA-binding response OmpR family regulator